MKIVCLGDSFTYGFGVQKNESWCSLLADRLSSDYKILNKGINGDRTSGMLARFGKDVSEESPAMS